MIKLEKSRTSLFQWMQSKDSYAAWNKDRTLDKRDYKTERQIEDVVCVCECWLREGKKGQ